MVRPTGSELATEHARQIDSIFTDDVPNMSHNGNQEEVKEA